MNKRQVKKSAGKVLMRPGWDRERRAAFAALKKAYGFHAAMAYTGRLVGLLRTGKGPRRKV